MLRLTLAARITLIFAMVLITVWLVAIGLVFRARLSDYDGLHFHAEQLAAMASLLEQESARRQLVLDALTSDTTTVRIDEGSLPSAPGPGETVARDAGARPVFVSRRSTDDLPGPFERLRRAGRGTIEYRVGLSGNQILVVDATAPLSVTASGLPIGLGAGLFGTVVALLALLVMQRETRPLARLAAALDGIDLAGEPRALPNVRRSAPEIRAVVAAFGRLQDRLAMTLQARMALVGGIAHDVKTFATRLRLRIDAIPDDSERERAAADIEDMTHLLDDALLASRFGAGELAPELIDPRDLVRQDVQDRVAEGARVDLREETSADVSVLADRLALRRIVANLVDNALRYGHAAHLALVESGDRLLLTVDDEGPGIPVSRRAQMFEPFTRLEGSRNRTTGGAGLGLAIVRSLVEASDGVIDIGDAPQGGARISVSLPVFRADRGA